MQITLHQNNHQGK